MSDEKRKSNKADKSTSRGIVSTLERNKRIQKDENKENKNKKKKDALEYIRDFPLFRAIKPKQGYTFRSDYFEIDKSFATIITVMHHEGADDNLGAFWGIQLIPRGMGTDVTIRKLEQVTRMSESWVDTHQGRAEGLMNTQAAETNRDGGSISSRQKLSKRQQQMTDIATDLIQGSSYLRVSIRLLVKAPTIEQLDDAVNKINRQYKDTFDTVFAAPYVGEQKRELMTLFGKMAQKMGRNFMFTSAEYAGSYNLVTRGIEDKRGEYIGQMEGDVNNSAVLMDIDNYESHVVIAGRAEARTLSGFDFNGERGADVWGAKLGMSALVRNRRVVHLVLNRSRVANIGIDLSDVTSVVNMTRGDINPFQMFGDKEEELSIFPAHLEKMCLMVEQIKPMEDPRIREDIKAALKKALNDFYVDARMWARDAQENRRLLRIVGIPHDQVPKLPEFLAYLNMEYEAQVTAANKDTDVMKGFRFLRDAFRDMLDSNGDLFNTITSDIIDRATVSSRVVYDFSTLIRRSRGVMMAQFVNALGFSVGNLTEGDVVVLHGVEQLDDGIKQYVRDQFDQLNDNGVRTVFVYNDAERMINDRSFNRFESADYTILGGMPKHVVELYEQTLRQNVPIALKSLLEHKERTRYYLRRGFDNVIFSSDLQMGFNYA